MWGRCCTRSELLKQIQIGCWIVVQMFDRSSLSTKLSLHTFGRLTPRSHRWYLKDATHLTGSEVWFIQWFPLPESWFVYDMEDVLNQCFGSDITFNMSWRWHPMSVITTKNPPKMWRIFANRRNKQITGFHRTVWLREKLRMGFATVGCLMVKFPSTGSFSWWNFAPQNHGGLWKMTSLTSIFNGWQKEPTTQLQCCGECIPNSPASGQPFYPTKKK